MEHEYLFQDRQDAARKLAHELMQLKFEDPVVIALPRGGVPIAAEIARRLRSPLDVLVVRKIGAPYNEEYGIGALSEDGFPLFSAEGLMEGSESTDEVQEIIRAEQIEMSRRRLEYRNRRPLIDVKDKTVILVDDGLATGVTAAAAGRYLKTKGAHDILLAVPVGPKTISSTLKKYVDEVLCLYRPIFFTGVGMWYEDFSPVTDEEVIKIMEGFYPPSGDFVSRQ